MPPKRRGRHTLKKKNYQIIRTRLIEISLKVDDLIYYKKPISEVEAEMYIKEVTSYQPECSQDKRSLQVIEKLVRCMKAIIAEHQERKLDDNTYDDCLDNGSSSPVYSVPDEDRTQMSQELAVKTSVNFNPIETLNTLENFHNYNRNDIELTEIIQGHDVGSVDNIVTKNINDYNDDNTERQSIKACTTNSPTNINSADVEIHKALSNLSLNNVDQDIMSTDIECSQSILKNFHDLDKHEQKNTPSVESIYRKSICGAVETLDIQRKLQNPIIDLTTNLRTVTDLNQIAEMRAGIVGDTTINSNDFNKTSNLSKQPRSITNFNDTNNSVKPANSVKIISVLNVAYNDLDTEISSNTCSNGVGSTPVPFSNKIKGKNIHVTPNNSIERYNAITNTLTENSEIKHKFQENITSKHSPPIKKKRNPRNKKVTDIKRKKDFKIAKSFSDKYKDPHTNKVKDSYEEKYVVLPDESNDTENITKKSSKRRTYSKNKAKTIRNHIPKDTTVPIYNKNVENDLSWLESIRFVREIGEEEYDGKLSNLNEDFWDNYYLPPNFDDRDFL